MGSMITASFKTLRTAALTVILGACYYFPYDTEGLVQYTPGHEDQWVEVLQRYYDHDLPSIQDIRWFMAPQERVYKECQGDTSTGCIYSDGTVFMREEFAQACWLGVHELMHPAMGDVYGDTDSDHTRCDWDDVDALCWWLQHGDPNSFPPKCRLTFKITPVQESR